MYRDLVGVPIVHALHKLRRTGAFRFHTDRRSDAASEGTCIVCTSLPCTIRSRYTFRDYRDCLGTPLVLARDPTMLYTCRCTKLCVCERGEVPS